MKLLLKRINIGLLVAMTILISFGIIFLAAGKDRISSDILFGASLVFPFIIAFKGIEFMIENQLFKAFMSILLLSLVCVISLILVFV